MSKKKSFSGSTMTLKDFHGGSIPSDLSLPSAPGVSVRPPEKAGAWGAATRPEYHRQRPGSSGGGSSAAAARGFDARAPFLPHPAQIGRHFEEDERKPFDVTAVIRRPAADLVPLRSDQIRPVSYFSQNSPVAQPSLSAPSPVLPSAGSGSNPWAPRKEAGGDPPPAGINAAGAVAASKFVQASAIEKVSSGRWHSKPTDAEATRIQEHDSIDRRFGESVRLADDEERDKTRNLGYVGAKERNPVTGIQSEGAGQHAKVVSMAHPEAKDRNLVVLNSDAYRPRSTEGRFIGSQGHQEVSERPKLKLLPRTKLVEPSEDRAPDDKQCYQPAIDAGLGANAPEIHGQFKSISVGADGDNQLVERPRLNLKPRSQALEQPDGALQRERNVLFGGARPREVVLKDRGVDFVAVDNSDLPPAANWFKHETAKSDSKPESVAATAHLIEKADSFQREQRSGRSLEKDDHRATIDNQQRDILKNDHWRNAREIEKQQEQPRHEPDTWRKPIEERKPAAPGLRFGKAASALELAQAFSKSISDTKSDDRNGSQRNQSSRSQAVPFSRLTDNPEFYAGSSKRQINGY